MLTSCIELATDTLRTEAIRYVMCLLPKQNIDLLNVVLSFLEQVSHLSVDTTAADGTVIPGNKMDLENMATVIAPNILYSKSKNPVDDDSFLAISAISNIMRSQADVWKVVSSCFIKESKLTEDEIDSRIDSSRVGQTT